ncbi:hypothetical protein BgAZ_204590 [Babesia gibsoni]|uniref:Uncharacterized protein n=1 Tax=Babesia gibsoni TaxID=33632 RepID=A0AAD8PDM3_BABGI|nr:hypothetical protein BgAZ_204590 [Babesia gibsoni]
MLVNWFVCVNTVWFLTLNVKAESRIPPGKFRFDDDIAYLTEGTTIDSLPKKKDEKPKEEATPPPTKDKTHIDANANKGERKNTQRGHKEAFISLSSDKIPRPQSIGYTVESYPNPLTNPGLCVHSSHGTHSMLCDPDGVLSDSQQVEINAMLRKEGKYVVLVALAYTILVVDKDKDAQHAFTEKLLRSWGQDDKEYVLMVIRESSVSQATYQMMSYPRYVFPKEKHLPQRNISSIESTFNKEHSDVFEALVVAIASINGCLSGHGTSK